MFCNLCQDTLTLYMNYPFTYNSCTYVVDHIKTFINKNEKEVWSPGHFEELVGLEIHN